ncbi:25S rRNA (cytosine(2870)-C(5))-methyltransferase [Seminavis robusta]|uniref:25S rRNA (Cytosine(2870)-C(5))-methyltransferase n=1 Tax=Seminavis robusta TaxID=568900 RepID=A0A9N8HJ65_9STRA|nr:25S rRNA (cytosine(2870)-C(5))-methyltransferase [Seminavis robusta]|eukprot:Sro836_g209070.1 25S rRNA (cytosine(2870)-C(5))-methyltransferase (657) ;mRNA; r:38033-40102
MVAKNSKKRKSTPRKEVAPKKKVVARPDSDEEEVEQEKPKSKRPVAKKQAKKQKEVSSSSDDSGSDSQEESSVSGDEPKSIKADDSGSEEEDTSPKEFTDENAKWLKPKKKKEQLLSSDDDDEEDDKEQDDDDSDDELLEVERQAQQLDEELLAEQEEAAAELQRTIDHDTQVYQLPTADEWDTEATDRLVAPSELQSHITQILYVLSEFQERREHGKSRADYIDWLVRFAAELHGYIPELVRYFCTMFSPPEAMEFLQASDRPRPLVIRTNTLKARRKDLAASLMKRGVTLDPLARWSKVGLKIVESPVPIGATPEYLGGLYMLQSAASMCPILALDPQPKERILDVSAAPGGKTSYMAQLMRNTGVIVANDLKAERQKATVANLHRLGVHNAMTCCHDGRQLGKKYPQRFDRILLDAPCSGLGVISRDPSVKVQRTIEDIKNCAHLQKELILAAIDALKVYRPGCDKKSSSDSGTMVYSTCSVAVYENEEVVNYALQKRDIKIVETGLEFGKPGFVRYQQQRFHPSLALTRRFYPHVHNMDGFYVAKIIKLSDRKPEDTLEPEEENEEKAAVPTNNDKASSKKKKKKNKKVLGKKRKGGDEEDDDNKDTEEDQAKKKKKGAKFSVPPPKPQPKEKKKTNAKVTKPRRKRAATDA